ncbi:MAG: RMD1 family protein [Hyphomicrobium sp.]
MIDHTPSATPPTFTARAHQIGERIDFKGLERTDSFSKNPLGYRTPRGGTIVLFKTGTAVFINMTQLEEEETIRGLGTRIGEPLSEREIETAQIVIGVEDDTVATTGVIHLKADDPSRLLLVADALAGSVSMALVERNLGGAFDRVSQTARSLKSGTLPGGKYADILEQLGDSLAIQSRLAGRIGMVDKPDVLWDHPELERLWTKLIDDYDLKSRANAIDQKLDVIRDSAKTLGDLLSTRTSHRLEWYIIALIVLEILIGFYDRFWK